MSLIGLPHEVLDQVVRYLDHTSLLRLTSTSNYFYVLRSVSNRRRSLQITDHFVRKSTLTLLALPSNIRGVILDYLDERSMLNLRSTYESLSQVRETWGISWGVRMANQGHHELAAPASPLLHLNAAKSAPWIEMTRHINGSRRLRTRICDLPCFGCLRIRPQCEFTFDSWRDFGTRKCEACTGDVTTDEDRFYQLQLDYIQGVYSYVMNKPVRC